MEGGEERNGGGGGEEWYICCPSQPWFSAVIGGPPQMMREAAVRAQRLCRFTAKSTPSNPCKASHRSPQSSTPKQSLAYCVCVCEHACVLMCVRLAFPAAHFWSVAVCVLECVCVWCTACSLISGRTCGTLNRMLENLNLSASQTRRGCASCEDFRPVWEV